MSDEASIWVDALTGLDVTSKSILSKLAGVADDDGGAWMRMCDLVQRVGASERTIQYRLRDLVGKGLLVEGGRTHRIGTRDVPIYEMQIDYPLVMAILEARARRKSDEAQLRGGGSMGAAGCTHRDPMGATDCTAMGATVCTPKEAIRGQEDADASSPGARDPLMADFERLEAAVPAAMLRYTDRGAAWDAFGELVRAGVEPEDLIGRGKAMAASPETRKRDFPMPGLQRWLAEGRWRGWEPSAEAAAKPNGNAAFEGLPGWLVQMVGEAKDFSFARSYLAGAVWREEDRTLVCARETARINLDQVVGRRCKAENITIAGPPDVRAAE